MKHLSALVRYLPLLIPLTLFSAPVFGAPQRPHIRAVAGGRSHSLALGTDGQLSSWGYNGAAGILGDGTEENRRLPMSVQGPGSIRALAVGYAHSLAVESNGTCWAWGVNSFGQLGSISNPLALNPAPVSALPPISGLAAGGAHSLAIGDEKVWSWGDNSSGQLGDGSTASRSVPAMVGHLDHVHAVAAGAEFSLALAEGTVWASGSNSDDGELGTGNSDRSAFPVRVHGLDGINAIAAGSFHSLAISNEFVWAWGYNAFGQLGVGHSEPTLIPVRVAQLSHVLQVCAGSSHSLALTREGLVWAWGANERGQLGDNSNEDHPFPVRVQGLTDVVSIGAGRYHSLAVRRDGTVWTWGGNDDYQLGDDTSLDSNVPVPVDGLLVLPSGQANPLARAGTFQRGDGMFASDYSTVISLDGQQGVKLDRLGRQSEALFGPNAWGSEWLLHFNGAEPDLPLPFQPPLAAFGQRTGGSRLNVDQSYSFGAYAGARADTAAVMVVTYRRHNMEPIATNFLALPDPRQTAEWAQFLAEGFTTTLEAQGLKTTLSWPPLSDVSWIPGSPGVLQLRHRANETATSYLYLVAVRGWVTGTSMATIHNTPTWSPLYSLEFDPRPAWEPVLVEQPHFEGIPQPHRYTGSSPEELRALTGPPSNAVALSPTNCLQLDDSPELRRHPVLDRFVEDLRRDPLALASYVWNEIQLTDGMSYHENGGQYERGIYAGGVNRGALGTFLEGQGSPVEQCALLIYLLRRSGVPAAYVFPENGALLLRQQELSKILRMQFHGLVDNQGASDIPDLVAVNYPWVAAYIDGQWHHLFPWLKDTEIIEGLDFYDYLPEPYNNGTRWLRHYVEGDTNILALSSRGNTPSVLLPPFIDRALRENFPGLSRDDLGMQVRERRQHHSAWDDFPQPHTLRGRTHASLNLTAVELAAFDPHLTNLFDTVSVEISSVRNPSRRVVTGDLRMADLHNRRFVVWHQRIPGSDPVKHRLILSLAPYRPDEGGTSAFTNDALLLRQQNVTNTLFVNDNELRLQIIHRRHRALPDIFRTRPPYHWDLFSGFSSSQEIISTRPLRKGDLAAICLNPGRVTKRMVRQHADEFWQLQREIRARPAKTFSPDLHQGLMAYLLGMTYYERITRFNEWNEQLHKMRTISWFAAGLARLSPQRFNGSLPYAEVKLVLPSLDMFQVRAAVAGNGTYRPDLGRDPALAARDYARFLTAEASAQEHQTIADFFGQEDALSTIKLLQLAALNRDRGNDHLLILDRSNYRTWGETKFHGRALKLHDPSIWRDVTNAFAAGTSIGSLAESGGDVQVFMTPGTNSYNQDTYRGLGALILSDAGDSALLSGNLHGGYGVMLPDSAFEPSALLSLHLLATGDDLRVQFEDPLSTEPALAPELWESDQAELILHADAEGLYEESPIDRASAQQMEEMLGVTGESATATRVAVAEERGFLGRVWEALRTVGSVIADPVHAVTGAFYIDSVDLHLPGPMPLELRRNYSSHCLARNQLGFGWKLNHMPFLSVSADGEVIYAAEPDGAIMGFQHAAGTEVWLPSLPLNPQWNNHSSGGVGSTANPFRARIVRSLEDAQEVYRLWGGDGSERIFVVLTFSNSISSVRPYLTRWQDCLGNYYQFSYGTNQPENDYGQVRQVTSSSGSFLGFYYDSYGQIVEAYTGDGRRVLYDYDQFGDLIRVTQADGSELAFEYQHETLTWTNRHKILTAPYSTHLLTREFKPAGRELRNEYDPQRRVVAQWSTVGPDLMPVRNAQFTYSNNFSLAVLTNAPTGWTRVQDIQGGESQFDYVDGLLTRLTDALGQKVVQEWFGPHDEGRPGAYPRSLRRSIDKRGLETTFSYDSRGNLTNATSRGDLTGANDTNETATTTFAYNADDLLIETTDPVGRRTRYLYDAQLKFLPALVSKSAGAAGAVLTLRSYYCVTNVSASGRTNYACGLIGQEVRAYGSPDAATNLWHHDGRGFVLAEVRPTGTSDPAVTNQFLYNDRGELIVARDGLGRSIRYRYDTMGRQLAAVVYAANEDTPISWDYSYYNQNGELVWSDGPCFEPEDYVWRDYDGAGRLIEEVRWRTEAKSDGSGVQAPRPEAAFAITRQEFDAFGNQIGTIDARGAHTLARYDLLGRKTALISLPAPGQSPATNLYFYEPGGEIVRRVNPLGSETVQEYTANGRLKYQRNADGSTRAWRYFLDGRSQRETLSNASFWETTYDEAARRVERTFCSPTNVLTRFITEFDRRGNLTRTVDPAGFGTTNVYDQLDRLCHTAGPVVETASLGQVQQIYRYGYGPDNSFRRVSNELGDASVTTEDVLGRPRLIEVWSKDQSLVRVTRFDYSPDHHARIQWEGSGSNAVRSVTFLDEAHRPILQSQSATPDGRRVVHSSYDANGNRTDQWQTTWKGLESRIGVSNHWDYDGHNRVIQQCAREGGTTTFDYDAAGNLTNRSMPGGLVWSATYNTAGAISSETDHAGGVVQRATHYAYFPPHHPWAGLLHQRRSANGSMTQTRSYDAALRIQSLSIRAPAAELTRRMEYDARGLITRLVEESPDGQSSVTMARVYDGYGHLTEEHIEIDGQTTSRLNQSWDAAGRRRVLAFDQAPHPFNYDYRADGLMAAAGFGGLRVGYVSGDNGLLLSRRASSLEREVAARDGEGHILSQTIRSAGKTIYRENLSWSADGHLASLEATRGNTAVATRYDYSMAGRLVSEEIDHHGQSEAVSYDFDQGDSTGPGTLTSALWRGQGFAHWQASTGDGLDSGHRLQREQTTVKERRATGQAPGADRLRAELNHRPLSVGFDPDTLDGSWTALLPLEPGPQVLSVQAQSASGFTAAATNHFVVSAHPDLIANEYDTQGRLVSRVWSTVTGQFLRRQTLLWDGDDRLIEVTALDNRGRGYTWSARYDALGRRVRTAFLAMTNSAHSPAPLGPGVRIDSHHDPAAEFMEVGWTVDGQSTWCFYGPDNSGRLGGLQGLGGLEGMVSSAGNGTAGWFIQDALGNVIGSRGFDSAAPVRWAQNALGSYGPHPRDLVHLAADCGPNSIETWREHLAWRGRQLDPTGLYHLGRRYYDPLSGRFLSPDPLGHDGSPDLYAFAHGDPANFFDPDGRVGKAALTGLGIVATGVINTSVAVATLPFAALERSVLHALTGEPVIPYLRDYLKAATGSFAAFAEVTRGAGFIPLLIALAHQVPVVGNFVPGPRGNMSGPPVIVISGGIYADTAAIDRARDYYETENMRAYGVSLPVLFAPYIRGTASEVLAALFAGYTARGLEHAVQVLAEVEPGSTIYLSAHSGGVMRSSISSFYLGFQDIGVARAFAEQGPGLGFYPNVDDLKANYSIGRDMVSNFGAILSLLYWGADTSHNWSFSNDAHWQGGQPGGGNEFNLPRSEFFKGVRPLNH